MPSRAELQPRSTGRPLEDGVHYPTMMAWEGEGCWILNLTKDNIDEYNKFPPTFDMDEHRGNLKKTGATWYSDARNDPEAALAMRAVAFEREAYSYTGDDNTENLAGKELAEVGQVSGCGVKHVEEAPGGKVMKDR